MITDNFRNYRIAKQLEQEQQNANAKQRFKDGLINDNKFYQLFNFEKTAFRLDFNIIINNRGGITEVGKLVRLDGNYNFKGSLTYYGESILTCYKIRYYLSNGKSLVIMPTATDYMTCAFYQGEEIKGNSAAKVIEQVLHLLYDIEGVGMLMNTRKHKRLLSAFAAVAYYRLPKEWQKKAIEYVKNLRTIE